MMSLGLPGKTNYTAPHCGDPDLTTAMGIGDRLTGNPLYGCGDIGRSLMIIQEMPNLSRSMLKR
jgi:hypothetical protein